MSRSRISQIAVHLPESGRTTEEVEARIAELNPGFEPPEGLIERFTGVRFRHIAPEDTEASDLAVAAIEKLFAAWGHGIDDVDLLIFAAASMDVIEPATAHIISDKLGGSCPVFDISNACSSVFNAIEVADALIRTGQYQRVLIACGERVSPGARYRGIATMDDYVHAGASHTVSDAGAALLVEASDEPGVIGHRSIANSSAWSATVVPLVHDKETETARVEYLGVKTLDLMKGLDQADITPLLDAVAGFGLKMDDFAVVCIHQAVLAYVEVFCERAGIPQERTIVTLADHGNVAAATLPLQLVKAVESGRLNPGDKVLLIGLASGLSLGVMAMRW
ncbi:3-oxoacyl-ACP synthase III family protein [Allokutzneria sp. NRRL B-24872]|uniref:3-oxoacyl-ACP synthase III family protein n=1 Tax=Allokutzneria sp. NRRL B-24872 TaxID=1137961 RepID=UPI000A3D2430|nr:ketoacyl-ACP synthase III [Allokutzneria sp. NRRL B-24872]